MVRKILADWLAGERTLHEAVRDWSDDRSRREMASVVAYFVGQAVVGSLLVTGTLRTVEWAVAVFRGTPPATVVGMVLLGVLVGELTVVLVEVRNVSRSVDSLVERSVDEADATRPIEGKVNNPGDEDGDTEMNRYTSGGLDR